jgi:CubicO group peptidase (beta-lactamase class C family)
MRSAPLGLVPVAIVLLVTCVANSSRQTDPRSAPGLETQLEQLRQKLHIPGLSAVVLKDGKFVWSKGFGYADLEKKTAATPQTNYRIASLTKTFASLLLFQLVEQGTVNLDDPITKYSPDFAKRFGGSATIRHVFSHTSQDPPGQNYRYDGNRFSYLTSVIEKTGGAPFRELLAKRILDPTGMAGSVPGQDIFDDRAKWAALLDPAHTKRYEAGLARLAKPYRLYGSETVAAVYPPTGISASAGLASSVDDLARYDAAIDAHTLIREETLSQAWTPTVSTDGRTLPYALGWFVTPANGVRFVWHYGYWPDSFSSLYLKVPAQDLTFILLANSDALSAPFRLGDGAILQSAFAHAFVRTFVSEAAAGSDETAQRLMTRWLEERRSSVRREIAVDPALLDGYLGDYEVESGERLTVTRQGNRLLFQLVRFPRSEAFAEGEDRFFLKAQELQVRFIRNAEGRVEQAEISFWGRRIRAPRVR